MQQDALCWVAELFAWSQCFACGWVLMDARRVCSRRACSRRSLGLQCACIDAGGNVREWPPYHPSLLRQCHLSQSILQLSASATPPAHLMPLMMHIVTDVPTCPSATHCLWQGLKSDPWCILSALTRTYTKIICSKTCISVR